MEPEYIPKPGDTVVALSSVTLSAGAFVGVLAGIIAGWSVGGVLGIIGGLAGGGICGYLVGALVGRHVWKADRGLVVIVRAGRESVPIAAKAGAIGGLSAGIIAGLIIGWFVMEGSLGILGILTAIGASGGLVICAGIGTLAALL